jgi:type VI secretion system protein ImpA
MPVRDDLLRPLPGPNPGGANLRYDPLYDKLKEARREDDAAPQGEWTHPRKLADWPQVIKLASDALATKSKDLQIAAWLTEGLAHQEGLAGLKSGLDLMRGLVEQHWDHLYPELEDGDTGLRAAPLDWVGRYLHPVIRSVPLNKSGHDFFRYKEARVTGYEADAAKDEKKLAARQAAIEDKKLTAEDFDKAFDATPKAWYKQLVADLNDCGQALQTLDGLAQAKFADAAPNFMDLQKGLDEVGDVARQLLTKKLQLDPDPPEATPSGALGEGPGGGGAAGAAGALAPEPANAEDAAGRIAVAVRFLRRADPKNPAPYLILRGFRWGELRARGGEVAPKLLTAPPTQLRTHLKGLLLDGKWAELLDAGEDVMATPLGRGWLDLQRYELTACGQLGSEYDLVASAIRTALVGLLRDVPCLPDLTLMDDTPTANVETRGWLQSSGLVAAAAQAAAEAAAQPTPAAPAMRPSLGRVFDRAMDEVRAGRPQKGIEVLMREAEQEKSARARFLCRSEAAGIMVEAGLEAVAMPILKELVDAIDAHKLEEWEAGTVVARPMGLMYRCLQKIGGAADAKDDLYRRICRLDPLQAIAFPGDVGAASRGGGSDGAA